MTSHIVTALTVSLVTNLVLFFIEWQIPGFVSVVFPLYLPLLVSFALGCVLLVLPVPSRQASLRVQLVTAVMVSLALGTALWPDLVVFGMWRPLFILALMATPVLLVLYASYDK